MKHVRHVIDVVTNNPISAFVILVALYLIIGIALNSIGLAWRLPNP